MDIAGRVAAKKVELDELRPSAEASLNALDASYDVLLTWTSNAIESNTLTWQETTQIFEKGLHAPSIVAKRLDHQLEVIGHKEALAFVHELARSSTPLRKVDVREIHALLVARIHPNEAGKYSERERFIQESTVALRKPWQLRALMTDFGKWLAQLQPDPDAAFEAHARLATIHPFSDGNGPTARLLMNLLLLRAGYPPVVIGPEQRVRYLKSLRKMQTLHDSEPYRQLLFERLETSLDDYLTKLRPKTAAEPGRHRV